MADAPSVIVRQGKREVRRLDAGDDRQDALRHGHRHEPRTAAKSAQPAQARCPAHSRMPGNNDAFPKVPLCASLGRGGAFGKDLIRLIDDGRLIAAPKEPQTGIEQARLNPSCGLPVPGERSGRRCRLP